MIEILHREFVYLWYYFDVQLRQIFWYWVLGIVLGSCVSVFLKDKIHGLFRFMSESRMRDEWLASFMMCSIPKNNP